MYEFLEWNLLFFMQLDFFVKEKKYGSIHENYLCNNRQRVSLCAFVKYNMLLLFIYKLLVIIFELKIKMSIKRIRYELLIIFFLSNARSKISFHREKRFRFEPVPLHVDEWLIKAKQNGTEIVTKLFSFRETRYPRKDVGERINPSTPSELDVPFFFSVFPFLFFLFFSFFFFNYIVGTRRGKRKRGVPGRINRHESASSQLRREGGRVCQPVKFVVTNLRRQIRVDIMRTMMHRREMASENSGKD